MLFRSDNISVHGSHMDAYPDTELLPVRQNLNAESAFSIHGSGGIVLQKACIRNQGGVVCVLHHTKLSRCQQHLHHNYIRYHS